MKIRRLAHLALAACSISCTTVYAVTPPGGWPETRSGTAEAAPTPPAAAPRATAPLSAPGPLVANVRVGHAQLSRTGDRTTHVLIEVRARDVAPKRLPAHHALVLDTSGSMAGDRLEHARRAARRWVEALPDGDQVSLIGFAHEATPIHLAVRLDAAHRPEILSAIDGLRPGGNTCMSCGLELALDAMNTSEATLRHVLLLGDGRANEGVLDDDGNRALTDRFRTEDIAVTTVGLGLDYDPHTLAPLAFRTNARHHFVDEPEHLTALFETEVERLKGVVSPRAMVELELAEGVELVELDAREHEVSGGGVAVSLGSFGPNQTKTVLVTLRVHDQPPGSLPLVAGHLRFDDGDSASHTLDLTAATRLVNGATSDIDPVVGMRLSRTETGSTLADAERLFREGRREEALARLKEGRRRVAARGRAADRTAAARGDHRRAQIQADIQRQLAELRRIEAAAERSTPGRASGRRMERAMLDARDPWFN